MLHVVGSIGLLTLAVGGYVAGVPLVTLWLPASPIIVGLLVTFLCLFVRPTGTARSWGSMGAAGAAATVIALGLPLAQAETAYGGEKLPLLFLLPFCVLAGSVILDRPQARRWWLVGTVVYGYVIAALMVLAPSQREALSGRVAVEGSTTIAGALGCGAAALVLVVAATTGARRPVLLGVLAVVPFAGMLLTASRGPLLAAVVAFLVVGFSARQHVRLWLAPLLLAGAAWGAWSLYQEGTALNRFETISADPSAGARLRLWRTTMDHVASHPLGTGWGSMDAVYSTTTGVRTLEARYPHNLLLEVAAEAGWLALLIVGALVVVALRRQSRAAASPVECAMLALLVFFVVESMVSGDVTTHRAMWVMIGAAVVARLPKPGARSTALMPTSEGLAGRTGRAIAGPRISLGG